jgi:Rrf2 family transcriptional regulator, iron-sulfur cluster assembly transcription factor
MFSRACSYAIRAAIYISSKTRNGSRIGIKDLCKEVEAPESFTAKILQKLVHDGIISSVKGPNGGFFINPESPEIRLIDIVKCIDGNSLFTGCALGFQKCSELRPCPLHHDFKAIRHRLTQMLEYNTVQALSENLTTGLVFLKNLEGNFKDIKKGAL